MIEDQYLELLSDVLQSGEERSDRTGTGTIGVFSPPILTHEFISDGNGGYSFPLFTSKRVPIRSVIAETLWFMQGRFDLESLRADGCIWWDDWERSDGTLGRVYGAQLRHWKSGNGEVDQLQTIIDTINTDPTSRRMVATMWNPAELNDMALPPCHGALIQFYVSCGNYLSLTVNIRSSDLFLGLPTNIPSYALVLLMVAKVTGLRPDRVNYVLGDAHIYKNHIDAVHTQLGRTSGFAPTITVDEVSTIKDFRLEHFTISNYNPAPSIKAPISV